MDYTKLFSLLSTAKEEGDIFEKIELTWFDSEGKPCHKIKKKLVEEEIAGTLLPIESSEKEALYVVAPIYEFFLAHTVLIGENTTLQKGKLFSGTTVYFEKKHFEVFEKNIIHSSIETVHAKTLFNKKILWKFKRSPLHEELNTYVLKNKKMILNSIHIQKGSTVELFLPNLKKKHFSMAKKMHIPLIALLEKGFLRDTTINIFDTPRLKKELSPYTNQKVTVEKNFSDSEGLLYRDIEKKLKLQLDTSKIIETIENKENKNFSKEKIIDELHKHESVEIGNKYHGNIQLPLWKNKGEFKTFSTPKEFKEFLGIEYDLKKNSLDTLYLIDNAGEPCEFLNYFSNPLINHLFTKQNDDMFKFTNITELFVLLYLESKQKISTTPTMIEISNMKKEKIFEIRRIIEKMTTTLLTTTISNNRLPRASKPQNILDHIISHAIQEISLIRNTYVESAKEQMVEQTSKELRKVTDHYSKKTLAKSEYYFLELIRETLKTLDFLDEPTKKIHEIIDEYYKEVRSTYHVGVEKDKLEDYNLSLLAEKLHNNNNKKLFIYVKNRESESIPHNIATSLNLEDSKTTIKKIHKEKLKQTFPKSYDDLLEYYKLHNSLPEEIHKKQLTLRVEVEKFIEEIPLFEGLKIKGISPSYILYSN